MALNFSSHCRSAREESAEKPPRIGSSALMKRSARKRIELATTARIKARRVVTGTGSPWSEQVFCTKLQNCKRAGVQTLPGPGWRRPISGVSVEQKSEIQIAFA